MMGFKNKRKPGLDVRVIGQQVDKAPVMPVPTLNEKLRPTAKQAAPNAQK